MVISVTGKNRAEKENRKCQSSGSILNKQAEEDIVEQCRSNMGLGKVCRCLQKGTADRSKGQHEVSEAGVGWSHWLFAPVHSETPSQPLTKDRGSIIWFHLFFIQMKPETL